MIDTGIICKSQFEGREVLGLRLNWHKRYITLGPVATLLGLAFKAYDPDHLVGHDEDLGITVALIPTHLSGVEIGRRHLPAMQVFQNGPNRGHDVFIPMDYIIGGEARLGQGWKMLMTALAAGRGISLPSLSAAGAAYAARTTGAYARIREQFGISISKFEGIEEPLARIAGIAYLLDARAAADLCGAQPGPSSRGHFRHHETARHRAAADRDRRRHGRPWRQGRDRRPAELPRRPLSVGAGRHHRRRRQHPDPQSDRVRTGRDPRASLSARRNDGASRRGPCQGAGCVRSGILETRRPQLYNHVPGLGPKLERRPVRAGARRRRCDAVLSPALALCLGVCALRRYGAVDPGRRAQAQGNAVGPLRRYPLRTLSCCRPR